MTDKTNDRDFEDIIAILGISVTADGLYIICNNYENVERFPSFVEYAKLHKAEIIDYLSKKENNRRNLRLYYY